MTDVSISITGATFDDGSTVSGLFKVSYDADGAIASITGQATVTSADGHTSTTFSNPYALSYANPTTSGDYEITFPTASGSGYTALYLDWNGQQPTGFSTATGVPYSSVQTTGAGGNSQPIPLSAAGHDNPADSFTITGAVFEDGSRLSGSFTVAYDPNTGAILGIQGSATVSGTNGQTTFSAPYVLSYADPNPSTGTYEITFGHADNAGGGTGYDSLYLDWNGQDPTQFNSTSTFPYSSVKTVQADGSQSQPIRLQNGGGSGDQPCFVRGTRIATPDGEVAVEHLREGDAVLLAGGGTSTVRWVGARAVRPDAQRRPEGVLPVRIRAGALDDGVPARDLLVSPDHALLLDGVLIPAKVLVNGASIAQPRVEGSVTYLHVMLDAHAPLLAEGAAAESYLDIGEHGSFGPPNRPGDDRAVVLHPAMAQLLRERWSFAPLLERGAVVERVRARILARSGGEWTGNPALRIRERGGDAVIESRSAVPAEISADPGDRRVLGVKVAALHVDGLEIPLDHPALRDGWHGMENDGRWTDGAAVVPAALRDGGTVSVVLAGSLRYRVAGSGMPGSWMAGSGIAASR